MINAQLRYYMHIANPDELTDYEWATMFEALNEIRKQEAKANKWKI
jgi:hypothetical protein